MSGLLITGTDTGVGKTVVTAALAAGLLQRQRGLRVGVWKPVETGWDPATAETTSDAARLRRAVASTAPLETICPYRFREPLAPAVAAARAGHTIDIAHLVELYGQHAAAADVVLVEGAGGLLVPLSDRTTYAELAHELGLALLIVAANRLGAVNHTALTARVATAAGLQVIGFVLNRPQKGDGDPSIATNRTSITGLTDLQCFAELPYTETLEDLLEHLDVRSIATAIGLDGP
jgi:dethiobiotin synthetase